MATRGLQPGFQHELIERSGEEMKAGQAYFHVKILCALWGKERALPKIKTILISKAFKLCGVSERYLFPAAVGDSRSISLTSEDAKR